MLISKELVEQLKAPASDETAHEVTVGAVTVRLFDRDRYSATLRELVVGAAPPAGAETRAYLSGRAAAIARGLSFLEEPLAVWELDGREGVAQLRSSPPLREGDAVSYWEVRLSAAGANLARYRWETGMAEREVLPYPATYASLGRLAEALTNALAEPAD